MNYISTRGAAPALGFEEVLLAGLASDGGLYVPETWPVLPAIRPMPYTAVAATVMTPYVDGTFAPDIFKTLIAEAYRSFNDPVVTPLRQLEDNLWLLELFHGPTLAFKDVALQLLGQMFSHVLHKQGRRVTIVGATSGDTGSAAIEAFRGSPHADVFILMPQGRVSEVQRRQMTTVTEENIHVIAIEGSFDDCQDLVKVLFADAAFRERHTLSAVNSINWARIMAQSVYYVAATLALGKPASFAVPTGNFGNVYAAHAARRMGLAIDRLLIASNANDVLTRFFETGIISMATVVPTLSPAMDIQVPSNFERLLFELYDGRGSELAADMTNLRKNGNLKLSAERFSRARSLFDAQRVDDTLTLQTIAETFHNNGVLVDPHTAVALAAARKTMSETAKNSETPLVVLASAHPAKFPEAVQRATGVNPELPAHLADLCSRQEKFVVLPAHVSEIKAFIAGRAAHG